MRDPARVTGATAGTSHTRTASHAFTHDVEEWEAQKIRQCSDGNNDADMDALVQYGLGDRKATTTTRVHIIRRDHHSAGIGSEEKQINEDCRRRSQEGKYFVQIYIDEKRGIKHRNRTCIGQTSAGHGTGGWCRVRMKPVQHAVDVITNPPRIVESVFRMVCEASPQEAL